MKTRTELALEACEGMSDEDLANRGPKGFAKMIMRKRKYAAAARMLAAGMPEITKNLVEQQAEIEKLKMQNKILQSQIETLESYSLPADGKTQQAADILAGITAKKA